MNQIIIDAAVKAQDKKNAAIVEAMKKATSNKRTALRVVREPPVPGAPYIMDEVRLARPSEGHYFSISLEF